ncbi:FAD-dependent oxidoreductase [Ectothiorhodospiraceae bacterium WFHF3C12]|nr:FAD-dependent oxidoreductase [Ectothiorhodospiraceae bacterium WFHF3C12]
MHVVVVGGGLIGTLSAYFLHRGGLQVTLIERNADLAAECSFANGAMLHASHGEPWNSPAAIRQLLGWMGREASPMLLRPTRLPYLLGWGVRFLANSTSRRHREATLANTRLARYSQARMEEIRDHADIQYDQARRGIAKVFWDQAALSEALSLSRIIEPLGIPFETWSAQALVDAEPALGANARHLAGAIYYPDDETGDPHLFTTGLGAFCAALGVDLRTGVTARRLVLERGRVAGVETDQGAIPADTVVLATGAEAPRLARDVGIRLPIEPVKGYSVTVDGAGLDELPRLPLIDDHHKVVLTRLGERLRAAGTAEFTGLDTAINRERIQLLMHQLGAILPGLRDPLFAAPRSEWACLRAMTPDGPPIVGRTRVDNLWVNVGAGHMGWTFAAGMGALLADLLTGRSPGLDPEPYRPDRYRGL